MGLLGSPRRWISWCFRPLAARAARAYVAGDTLTDALIVSDSLYQRGMGATLGYWNDVDESPRLVADAYLAAIDALARREHAYLSIKLPALGFSDELMSEVVARAIRGRVRLHVDSMAIEFADQTRAMIDQFLESGAEISTTLPGRWARSVADAQWAIERGLTVRVVKGQWPDPADPRRDQRAGYLEVIDALAGRARHVAVATHDVPLLVEAVNRLGEHGTSCELELLYGLRAQPAIEQADQLALGVHVYVPYGKAFLPYALGRLGRDPRILWWLMRDLMTGNDAWLAPRARREPDFDDTEAESVGQGE